MLVLHNMVEGVLASFSLSLSLSISLFLIRVSESVGARNYGTGSCPWPPQGWQREMRFRPIQKPLSAPYFCMASMVY